MKYWKSKKFLKIWTFWKSKNLKYFESLKKNSENLKNFENQKYSEILEDYEILTIFNIVPTP